MKHKHPPSVFVIRKNTRKKVLVLVDGLREGDRIELVEGLTLRMDSSPVETPEGFWRLRGNAGWDVVHVLPDGRLLELLS